MNLESVRQCGLQSKPEKEKGTGLIVSVSTHAQPSPLYFKAFVSESRLVLAHSPMCCHGNGYKHAFNFLFIA